jgi:hypothetical protein
MANSMYQCPKCRTLIDCGERSDGERMLCKTCGRRSTFKHDAAEETDCYPECFDSGHWRLGAVVTKPKKKKRGGIGCPHPDGVWRWQSGLRDGSVVQHASAVVPEAPHWCRKHNRACSVPCPYCAAAKIGEVA